jgi:hypothetical protein
VQNDQTSIDNKEIPGITGGALDSHEELPGPVYLQGSEKGHVAYRSIVITPASDAALSIITPKLKREVDSHATRSN